METHIQVHDPNNNLKPTNLAGPARLGWNGRLDLTYLFSKHLGLTCTFVTSVNEAAAPDSMELFLPPDYIPPMGWGSTSLSYEYSTKKWYTNSFILGPVVFFSYKSFSLTLHAAGGLQQVKCPETLLVEKGYRWIMFQPNEPYTLITDQPRLVSYNFVFDGGVYFSVFLTKRFGILLSLDYLASAASFKGQSGYTFDIDDGINLTHMVGIESVKFDKNISLFLFNAGVSYRIK